MKFGVIGYGKMGSSIVKGMLEKNLLSKNELLIYDTYAPVCKNLKNDGISVAESIQQVFDECVAVLLSVKPQELDNVFSAVKSKENISIISIMAGISIKTIQQKFNACKIARVMPNTCAMVGQSASSMCFSDNCEQKDKAFFYEIVSSFGSVSIIDESLMDEVIPLAGSFTAYAYYYAKAFVDSAVSRGVPYDIALKLVANSMSGSAEMIRQSGKDLETLIKDVCSKGGTTLAGLEKLEKGNLAKIVDDCCVACSERSRELGKNK